VVNECHTADGWTKSVRGTARVAGASGPNTKLKVTFLRPFKGNCGIIDLDTGYRWAVAGEPGRGYRWILSREPRLDDSLYDRIIESAKRQGMKWDASRERLSLC